MIVTLFHRLDESPHEAVGLVPVRRVVGEDVPVAGVAGIAQQVRLGLQHESGGEDLGHDQFGIDAVQSLARIDGVALAGSGFGVVVDDAEDPAGGEGVEDAS